MIKKQKIIPKKINTKLVRPARMKCQVHKSKIKNKLK